MSMFSIPTYWRAVGYVATGTAISQILPVLGSFVIARLYTPDDFGIFSVWLGLVSLAATAVTGRYETALPIVKDGNVRRISMLAVLFTASLGSLLLFLVSFILIPFFSDVTGSTPILLLVIFFPASLSMAFFSAWQSWAAAEGMYQNLSYIRIAQTGMVSLLQIGFGFFNSSVEAMGLGFLLGNLIALLYFIYLMPVRLVGISRLLKATRVFWSRHSNFFKFSLPADTINTAAAQLPVLIVAARFGVDMAGLLAMTMRILGAPIGLLGKSVLDVFKRHAAVSYRERGECRADYVRTFRVLAIASFGFCVFMATLSEPIFALALGESWRGAGTIAVWLLPLFALRFMASPLSYMVYIAGKQHVDLVWQIALIAMTIAALNIPREHNIALQAYSLGYSLLYIFYLAMSYRFSLGIPR